MNMRSRTRWIPVALFAGAMIWSGSVFADPPAAQVADDAMMYDAEAYTVYVEDTMKKLDRLYLDFCGTCGVDAEKSRAAKEEFLVTVRDLMQHMNGRFDSLDPKQGASLSPTETLVSVHALTMLVDILAETQLEAMRPHPYVD
jgi:hypothetical protein